MTTRKAVQWTILGTSLLISFSQAVRAADPPSERSLVNQVRELQTLTAVLQNEVTNLQAQNSALAAVIEALQDQVDDLQPPPQSLIAIAPYVSLQTLNGQPTVRFSRVNVQIVNGLEQTFSTNALGNLILGYDESRSSGPSSCSLGVFVDGTLLEDQASCESRGFTWAQSHKTGSHYLVMGQGGNYSRAAGIVAGVNNTSNNDFASVLAGFGNTASGPAALVVSGQSNKASGNSAIVAGGIANSADGDQASVIGGGFNAALEAQASVTGGSGNIASGTFSTISGGASNGTTGTASHVSGGVNNDADGSFSSVLGGQSQQATNEFQTIPPLP